MIPTIILLFGVGATFFLAIWLPLVWRAQHPSREALDAVFKAITAGMPERVLQASSRSESEPHELNWKDSYLNLNSEGTVILHLGRPVAELNGEVFGSYALVNRKTGVNQKEFDALMAMLRQQASDLSASS